MEVIYYMRNYYPLTAAQKMHHNWIMDYGTQQVSGVSVVASVQAELDFGLLKKCIQMETERSGWFFRNYPFLDFPTYLSFASNNCFLQRPYIVRFIIFNRLFVPSTKPLL